MDSRAREILDEQLPFARWEARELEKTQLGLEPSPPPEGASAESWRAHLMRVRCFFDPARAETRWRGSEAVRTQFDNFEEFRAFCRAIHATPTQVLSESELLAYRLALASEAADPEIGAKPSGPVEPAAAPEGAE